jgi:ubiquinone/menaquinone biosynthesis C-methylase UbiE
VPTFFEPCARLLVAEAGVRPGDRAIDVACGTGIVARFLAQRVGPRGSVVGIDVNPGMVEAANELALDARPEIAWQVGSAEALPIADGAIDVACCQQGLQFFADPAAAVSELRRVLRPNGRLAIAVWRPIEHHATFEAFAATLDEHLGRDMGEILRAPFAGPPLADLRAMLDAVGFERVAATIGSFTVRFSAAREFVRREIASSPLAGRFDAQDEPTRDALVDELDRRLQPWVDDAGITFPMVTWLITAVAGHAG